ncbi:nucleoporin GLE1-like, partial [Zootermopsis nevadensis]
WNTFIVSLKFVIFDCFQWQGEHTVSSKPEAAFAIAAVIEALWADFPDFGELILGHFYRECPYLVPIFMPQVEGQSNEDYYRLLGYHYNENGEVEKQDKFLKRMSGIMRLYTAVLVTRPCRYQQNKSHPHGLKHAWHWISCILNMDPRPDICATLLYDFLEVAGSAMYSHYGRQFQKLLHLICKEYFPKIEKVTPSVSSGPVCRLQALLQKILKQGHIPPPAGLLPSDFW